MSEATKDIENHDILNEEEVVETWFNEFRNSDWDPKYIQRYESGSFGHFSQVIWADTHQIGCAYITKTGNIGQWFQK